MALSVAMMLTMFPTGVLADDFDYDEGNTAGVTVSAEGQSDENQGEGESASIVSEEPAPVESEDQTTDPVESASQETQPVESEDQTTDPVESESQTTETVESESQATEPAASASQATDTVESESQTTDPAASSSQAAEPEEKDNSVNTADLYDPQPTDITAKQTTINVGQSLVDLTGSGVGGYGGTPVHQWSTEDETVATVTGNGSKATVTGVGVGKTKISHYCYREFYGWKTNEKTETIEIEVVAKVTDASIQVKDDASATSVTFSKYATPPVLEAVVTPTDAAYKSCAWSVDRSDVLEVNAETGEITAKSMGEATVTLTVTNYDDSEVKATLPVTVTNPIPTSAVITVTEGKADDLYPQDTLTLVPGVEPGSADEYNCAWVSSDAEVATVAGDATEATVTAMKDGTATITLTVTPKSAEAAASADEASPAADAAQSVKTAEITVKVNAVTPAESVTIRSDKETVRVRETVQFTAAVNPTNAQGSYEWKTDNRQVLSIDKNGLATGEAAGTANVTVTFKGKDGNEITSDPIKITVTPAAQQYKREALVYYLKDPTKDANSNASDQWGPGSLGTATVDVAGATWANDKNCFNVKGRVISWPEGYGDGVVPRDTTSGSVWMTIFANYKESVQKELKRTITTNDVEEIWLEPAKISKDNGTTPDMHLDCNVRIKCHDIVMVRFMVQDVNDPTAIQVKAMNRVANSTVSATDVPSYPATKEDGKYAFRGWYLNSDFSGSEIPFEPDYQLGKDNVTFYGRYVQQHTVTYKLDENAANAYATDNVYADDTHTVIAAPTKDGYEFTGWKLDESTTYQPGNTFKMPNSDVTLVAQWKATTRSYTVNYYWNGTTTKVAEPSTGTANVGEKIENLTPVPVEGYTPVSTESKSITIDEDATKNVITFFYYKDVTLTANSATETYDGTAKSVSGFTGAPEDADFSAITVVATGTNADTYPANFPERTVDTVDAAGKYIVTAAENGKLTIAKRTVTLKSADLNKKYDGTALVNGETALETETGWAEGEGATYTFTGSQTLVGSSANAFSYTLNDGTKADNYEIAKTEGTLTVENRAENEKYEITVTAKSDTKTYNGREQNVTGIVTNEFTVNGQKYIVSGLTAEGKGTDAGEYTAKVTGIAVVKDTADNDVTAQFTVKTENGKLTIAKRTVTLKSADLNKKYDGTALVNGETALETETGWAEGEGATYTFTGSQTLVGSSANAFSYTLNDGTKADNYEIAKTEGTLTVENRAENEKYEITVTAKSDTKTYNGREQNVTGIVTNEFTVNGQKYIVSGLTAEAKGTDVDTYTTTVTGTAVVTDNLGHDVTAQFTVKPENGTLTIKAKKVTITAKDNTGITYDGHSHGGNGYEATEVAEGDKIDSVTISGSKVDAGVYNDALVPSDAKIINANGRDVTQNYEFTYTKGKLEIKPVTDEVTVTIEGNSHTVSYNGNPQSVEGYKVVSISNNLYKEANFTFTGEAKATGTEANTYAMGLAENQFTNTSANFEHVKFVVTDGKLVITPKNIVPGENSKLSVTAPNEVIYNGQSQKQPPVVMDDTVTLVEGKDYDLSYSSDTTNAGDVTITVTGKGNYSGVTTVSYKITPRGVLLTSASAHKEYDGTPVTKDGAIDHYFYFDENGEIVETLANGFVAGEVTEIHATGSVTNVSDGEVTNTITYKTGEKFNENNYTITKNEGKLYITPVTDEVVVSITGKNDTVTYNGNPQSVEGYGYTVKIAGNPSDLYKDTDFTFTGKAKATGTDADTYAMGLAENQFANTSANFTNVKFSVEDGWLRINPREGVVVTIKGNTDTVPYDGNPHTVEGYTVEFTKNPDDLYKEADFQLNGKAQAAGTNAGTYYMGFVATSFENTNPNFKNVVFNITDGWLKITPKNIVPGENNKDLTATAPEDVVYSGESQQQKPIVKDGDKVLEEGKDYDLSYSEDTTNVGTVTVTINGNGNYGSKFEVTYKITPAPLKITTNSAEKTYDGSALTAGGKIEGLVKDETATLKTTGSQTEVGESKNTYEIEWGTAKETNYKIAEEDIGTLKVNARSGGGSSSKPTPEEEPTPTPTPTPLPTLPTTPAPTTPARRVTRSTATVTEPASRPTEQITENETPKAESEPEVIEDEETPLAPMATGAWALVNLILMLLTVLASLLLLLGYLGKKKYAKEDEYGNALHDANGNEIIDYTRNKKGFWRVASLIPAVAAVIAFVLTENMRLPMIMVDRWTLLMVIIAVVQLIVAVLCKKKKESEEDENQANA